jgi:hypothetical protein
VSFPFIFRNDLGHFCSPTTSLAAIQAAKEGFKEVTLKHFEWAKVTALFRFLWS